MKKTEFIETMKERATMFGEIEVQEVKRTDKTYLGLMVKKVGVPTPVVNLDDLYEQYENGWSIEKCYEIMEELLDKKADGLDTTVVTDYNKAKERLYLRVFGNVSEEVAYRKVADMFLVPYLQIDELPGATVKVDKKLMSYWGISEEEVFAQAEINQAKIRPATIRNLAEILGIPADVPLYVVSIENGVCGASAIFYDGVVDRVREIIGEDFYILPSSIHEVITIPKSTHQNVKALQEMVETINDTEVNENERLTNSVYTYDFETREFKKISA